MKKTMMLMAGALIASVVVASAQEVLSANAVGYIKKTLPAGGDLIAITIPLDNMNADSNVWGATSIAQESPTGSTVYFWDPGSQGWVIGTKVANKGWQTTTNRVVLPGEGFFLKGPAETNYNVDVTITGEVPADTSLQRAIPGGNAFGALGNPYPVDKAWGEMSAASNATAGSTVYFWDTGAQGWVMGTKVLNKGWQTTSNRVIQAGEGFLLKEAASVTTWTESKPYTWP